MTRNRARVRRLHRSVGRLIVALVVLPMLVATLVLSASFDPAPDTRALAVPPIPTGAGGSHGLSPAGVGIHYRPTGTDRVAGSLVVYASLSVTTPVANRTSADGGQFVWFNTTASGGSGGYTYTWTGLPTGCGGSTATVLCDPTYPGNFSVRVKVRDSVAATVTSGARAFTVWSDPTITTPTASRSSADVGQGATFSVTGGGGSGGLVFAWVALPPGNCSVMGTTVQCTKFTGAGTWPVMASVNDTNGFNASSQRLQFNVYEVPIITPPAASPHSVDVGQTVIIHALVALGTASYRYAWSGLPSPCSAAVDPTSCAPLLAGTYTIALVVTDTNGARVTSVPLTLVVSRLPTIGSVSASRPSADVGQSVTFSATTSTGSGNDTFAWSGLPVGCSEQADPLTCTVLFQGNYTVRLTLTDSNGVVSGPTGSLALTVYQDPAANLQVDRLLVDENVAVTFTTLASLGSGGYVYAYSGLPPGCEVTDASFACAPTATGSFTVHVKVTDSNGWAVTSNALVIDVVPPLVVDWSETPAHPVTGQAVTFASAASGGAAPVSYAWVFGDGSTDKGTSVSHPYSAARSYTVSLWVNDSAHGSVRKILTLSVSEAPTTTILGLPPVEGYAVLGGVTATMAAGVVVAVFLRRGGKASTEAPQPAPESAPGDPPASP